MKPIIKKFELKDGKIVFYAEQDDTLLRLKIVDEVIKNDHVGIWLEPLVQKLEEEKCYLEIDALDLVLKKWLLNNPNAYRFFFADDMYAFKLKNDGEKSILNDEVAR